MAAVNRLRFLAPLPQAQDTIVEAGGIAVLVALATAPDPDASAAHVRKQASYAVSGLSLSRHTERVIASGGVEALLGAVAGRRSDGGRIERPEAQLVLSGAAALDRLARSPNGAGAVLRCGVQPLVDLLEETTLDLGGREAFPRRLCLTSVSDL